VVVNQTEVQGEFVNHAICSKHWARAGENTGEKDCCRSEGAGGGGISDEGGIAEEEHTHQLGAACFGVKLQGGFQKGSAGARCFEETRDGIRRKTFNS